MAFGVGYLGAMAARLDPDTSFTIGVEVGLQNIVIAMLIANLILKRPEFGMFALTQAFVAISLLPLMTFAWRKVNSRSA